ncbi:type VII secretion protein EccCa [Streptomyces sp. WAC06614]|uniref:type VII secretion protein EccCa n=1 Tax=Streptomyces sp. WAC06614 TaxID=2487416 RepID=UPI000F784437|nr:type VII secretion protein EccCa [Streptomyces sp. WAC06614]RSS68498.1 type VII secretion protein EccCa [Streptomyces sp. WAC06614]
MPDGEIQLQEPPGLPEKQTGLGNIITMVPMALSSLSMVFIFLRPNGGLMTYIAMGTMAVSAIGMVVTQIIRGSADRKEELTAERRDYLRYLAQMRRQVRKDIRSQQEALAWRNPAPTELMALVRTSRLWERRASHPDFSDVRIATGSQRLAVRLAPLATKPVEDLEPLGAHALRRFIHAYGQVADQPVAIHLRGFAHVLVRAEPAGSGHGPGAVTGTRPGTGTGAVTGAGPHPADSAIDSDPDSDQGVRALARGVLAQLVTLHAPDELRIAVVAAPDRRAHWEWTKWLPHALHPDETDAAGPLRLVAGTIGELEQLLGEEFGARPPYEPDAVPSRDEPYTVIVLDGATFATPHRAALGGYRNTTVIDIGSTLDWTHNRLTLRLRITEDTDGTGRRTLEMVGADRNRKDEITVLGSPDGLSLAAATRLAAFMAPYRLGDVLDAGEPLAGDFDLTTLLGIQDLYDFDVARQWAQRHPSHKLRVPLGIGPDGTPIDLDIKESAQGGMGPHGMLIGATGSGKSELLRTLVLALALTHSSEILNFVLVDFKGGATFLGLDRLPHTSAVITNLADEADLVDRMRDALHGEMIRRQELLRAAGNYASLLEYETARAAGTPLDPLPTLFVVVDEFSELLAAHRDFMDLFVMIGRLGRSLGVHLLLASQRLDEGRVHQLESHLSYRIGLRTFSAMESRGVLGVPDAYQLPPQPGNGYLRSDISTLTRFKAAYVSGAYRHKRRVAAQRAVIDGRVVAFGTAYVPPARPLPAVPAAPAVPDALDAPDVPEEEGGTATAEETRSLLDIAAERLLDAGPSAYQVWLPPLDVPPTLDELLPPIAPHPTYGFAVEGEARGTLKVPVGIVDRPFQQVRDLLVADLGGADGHIGIAGAPQSGKSTLIRTLMTALALTHTPGEVQFYCLDFGGGTLSGLRGLPHVGGITGRHDPDRVLRTVAEVNSVVTRREKYFAELGIDSVAAFRRRKAAGELPDDPHGDVFLVIDGWNTLRQEFMDLVQPLTLLSQRGLNYGVHLVVGTTRWGEITGALRDQLQTRFELRLGDPVDSVIKMRAAAKVPKSPGRGLTADEMHFLCALPRTDGLGTTDDLGEGIADLVDAVADHWTGPRAPEVRMLPSVLDPADLPGPHGTLRIPLGLEEHDVQPLWHDFSQDPHLIVVGDSESGKTNLLRHVAAQVMRAYAPDRARFMLVDFRREMYATVPEEYRLGYAVSADPARQMVTGAANALANRLPSADITPDRLKLRDWWSGPELFLIVDDYDLIGGSMSAHPFAAVLDHLAQGAEIGLHLIVARSANGAGRGLSDPLLRKLQDVNTPAVLLSCPPAEGYLFGGTKPKVLPAGRALHITRRRTVQLQTPLLGPEGSQPSQNGAEG